MTKKDKLTDELERVIGFTAWVKKNYGYTVGGGLWNHSLKFHLILAIAQKWLRDEKEIQVHAYWDKDADYQCYFGELKKDIKIHGKSFHFSTYEEALERGVIMAIEELINK